MRLDLPGSPHLTYCTNIHPGESWKEVSENVRTRVASVRRELGVSRLGVGLRLSARAARELAAPDELEAFSELLRSNGMYVFTLNGFPYGPFHGQAVKDSVYEPDWTHPERLAYSDQLADLLVELLPAGMQGSISTVPGGFRARTSSPAARERIAQQLSRHALRLDRLRCERGVSLALALEPEPACLLETTSDAVRFFEQDLLGRASLSRLAREVGRSPGECEQVLRRHLALCVDACHAAVEFEDPHTLCERLERAGIRVAKLQLSCGLRVPRLESDTDECLSPYDDAVYLHQVVERSGAELRRFDDLCDAFAHLRHRVARGASLEGEWRVHCHVPIFRAPPAPLDSTREFLEVLLARQRKRPIAQHLEVETYTWDVLPREVRGRSVEEDVVRELRWVLSRLGDSPAETALADPAPPLVSS